MAPGDATAQSSGVSSRTRGYADVVGQALGLTGILVPAVGLGVRWVAFGLGSPVPSPMTLAAGSPIVNLAETGGLALLYPAAVAIPAFIFLSTFLSFSQHRKHVRGRIEEVGERLTTAKKEYDKEHRQLSDEQKGLLERFKEESLDSDAAKTDELGEQLKVLGARMRALETRSKDAKQLSDEADKLSAEAQRVEAHYPGWFKWLRTHRGGAVFGAVATAIIALLFLPGWPASLLPVAGLAVPFALFALLNRPTRPGPPGLTLALVTPSLIALLLIGVFYSGLAGSGLGLTTGNYRFGSAGQRIALPSGVYVELAQDSGLVYLHPCPSPSGTVVTVSETAIEVVTSDRAGDLGAGPNLWSVLFGSQAGTGIRYECR
jgi:hypothetical protein